jgi:hypothetical protein
MNFECPATQADNSLRIRRPIQSGWQENGARAAHFTVSALPCYFFAVESLCHPVPFLFAVDLNGPSTYFPQVHHDNFLSLRKASQRAPNRLGVVPGDGPLHIHYHSDIITRSPDGDADAVLGEGAGFSCMLRICCCLAHCHKGMRAV